MPSTIFSGSIQPTTNVIHQVGTINFSGVYVFKNDLGQMVNGDEIEIDISDRIGAGTISSLYHVSYANRQATQVKISPPFVIESGGPYVSIVKRAGGSGWFYFSVVNI